MTKKSTIIILIILIVILIMAGVLVFKGTGCKKTTNTNQETTKTNLNTNSAVKNTNGTAPKGNVNSNDPLANFQQYDNKVVDISSRDGKVKGRIGFKLGYDESGKYPMIKTATFLLINEALPQKKDNQGFTGYYYIGHLSKAGEERSDNHGNVSGAFCNKDQMIDVIAAIDDFASATNIYSDCLGPMGSFDQTTETFFHHFNSYYLLNEFNYNDIIAENKFSVIDFSQYMTIANEYNGFSPNTDLATAEGPIEKTYDIEYSK